MLNSSKIKVLLLFVCLRLSGFNLTDLLITGYGSEAVKPVYRSYSCSFHDFPMNSLSSGVEFSDDLRGGGISLKEYIFFSRYRFFSDKSTLLMLCSEDSRFTGCYSYRTGEFQSFYEKKGCHLSFGKQAGPFSSLITTGLQKGDYVLSAGFNKRHFGLESFRQIKKYNADLSEKQGKDLIDLHLNEASKKSGVTSYLTYSDWKAGFFTFNQYHEPSTGLLPSAYEIRPFLSSEKNGYFIEFNQNKSSFYLSRFRETGDARIEFFQNQNYFGWAGMPVYLRKNTSSGISFPFKRGKAGVDISSGCAQFCGRSRIDSWPFLSIPDYFQSAGTAFYSARFGLLQQNFWYQFSRRRLDFDIGISHALLRGDGNLSTFYSTFFGFLKIPVDSYSLKYTEADILIPSFSVSSRMSEKFTVRLKIAQYIPCRTRKKEESAITSQTSGSSSSTPERKKKIRGGLVTGMELVWQF